MASWLISSLKKARNSLTETVRKLSNNDVTAEELRNELEFVQAGTVGTGGFAESVAVLEEWTRKLQSDDDRYEEEKEKFNLCTFREVFFSCGALETAVISVYTARRECFDFHATPNLEFTQKFRELLHLCFVEFIADWEPLFACFFRSADDVQEALALLVRLFVPGRAVIHCADVVNLIHREIEELGPLLPPAVGDPDIQSLALKKHAELTAALVEVSERMHEAKQALKEHRKAVLAEFNVAVAEWTQNQRLLGERSRARLAEIQGSLRTLRTQTDAEIAEINKAVKETETKMENFKTQATAVKESMSATETAIGKQAERKSEAKRKLVSTAEAQNEAESDRNFQVERLKNLIAKNLDLKELRQTELVAIANFQDILRAQVPSRIPRAREIACEAISEFFAQAAVLLGADGLGHTATPAETSEISKALEDFAEFQVPEAAKVRDLLA